MKIFRKNHVYQEFNKSYYNLSMGGSGIDTMFYNFNIWIDQFPMPKMIFFYWSHLNRYLIDFKYNLLLFTISSSSRRKKHKW